MDKFYLNREALTKDDLGAIVKIRNGDKVEYGVVFYIYKDGSFSAMSKTGFWALAERTNWERTGHRVDLSYIYNALDDVEAALGGDENG